MRRGSGWRVHVHWCPKGFLGSSVLDPRALFGLLGCPSCSSHKVHEWGVPPAFSLQLSPDTPLACGHHKCYPCQSQCQSMTVKFWSSIPVVQEYNRVAAIVQMGATMFPSHCSGCPRMYYIGAKTLQSRQSVKRCCSLSFSFPSSKSPVRCCIGVVICAFASMQTTSGASFPAL